MGSLQGFLFGLSFMLCARSCALQSVGVFCSADDKVLQYYKDEAFLLDLN